MTSLNCIVNNIAIRWKQTTLNFYGCHIGIFFLYVFDNYILNVFFEILKKRIHLCKAISYIFEGAKKHENCGYVMSNELLDFNRISIKPSKIHEVGFFLML
jgi:hypothetical protein